MNLLSQTLNTVALTPYTISFWMASDGNTPNEYDVEWNNVALFDQAVPATTWRNLIFSVLGTGRDTLTISSRDDPGYLGTDDVCVAASACTASAVPEPATLLLLGAGLFGLGLDALAESRVTGTAWVLSSAS